MELNGSNSEPSPSTSYGCSYAPYEEEPVKEALFGYARNEIVIAPWATRRYSLSIDGLHDEIIDLFDWLKPSQIETQVRHNVYEKMKAVILKRWKDNNLQISVFGSLRTELFLPTSDIDVLVECPAWGSGVPIEILEDTAGALRDSGLAEKVDVYSGAYVPIVKMVDKDTKLSLDISFNTVQGMKAADYIQMKKREYPVIEPLVLILKQFLIQRNLNQTYTGGLSSYGLILMLVSFLQMYATRVRGRDYRSVNLGELLIRFFEVYGQEFNYQKVRINVAACRYEPKRPIKEHFPILSLVDPLLSTNEVGKSTYNFAAIQQSFLQALQVLKGVNVRDRRRSTVFCSKAYRGNMMSLIIPFSAYQISYRNWLKSCSLSLKNHQRTNGKGHEEEVEGVRISQLVTNTFLAPVLNLDSIKWHDALIRCTKEKKVLSLQQPGPVKKSLPESKDNILTNEDVRKDNYTNGPERRHSDGESMQRKSSNVGSTRPANSFNRGGQSNGVRSSFLKPENSCEDTVFNGFKCDDPRSPSPSENATPRNGVSQSASHSSDTLRATERSRSTSTGDRRPRSFAGAVVFRNSNCKPVTNGQSVPHNVNQGTQYSNNYRPHHNSGGRNVRSDKSSCSSNGFHWGHDARKNENFPQLQQAARCEHFPVINGHNKFLENGRNGTAPYVNAANNAVPTPAGSLNSESGNGTGSDCDSTGSSREPPENNDFFEVVKKKKSLKMR